MTSSGPSRRSLRSPEPARANVTDTAGGSGGIGRLLSNLRTEERDHTPRGEGDPVRIPTPRVYLVRMVVFLVLTGFIILILSPQILSAFLANPGLNGLIVGVLLIGIILCFRQVIRLFREIGWVNDFRIADPGIELDRQPVLLAPMAAMLRDRAGRMALTSQATRSLLDSVGARLDEARDISRYMISLLVFLGLLGTFWGLLETVGSVAGTIQQLDVGGGDLGLVFEDLKSGLEAPLSGMGTAFSSSLFGLAGSLILGFLDLQAGQAQNRFYMDLEDWLSTVTDLSMETAPNGEAGNTPEHLARMQAGLERLSRQIGDSGGQNRATTQAMADLAEGIQGLVQHMRTEQKVLRDWIDSQGEQQRIMNTYLARLSGREDGDDTKS